MGLCHSQIATDAKMSGTNYRKIVVTPEKFGSRDFAEATKIVEVELPSIPPGTVPQSILVITTLLLQAFHALDFSSGQIYGTRPRTVI